MSFSDLFIGPQWQKHTSAIGAIIRSPCWLKASLRYSEFWAFHMIGKCQTIAGMLCRAGLIMPTVEVRFQDLHAETTVFADLSRNLPSIFRSIRDPMEVSSLPLPAIARPQCCTSPTVSKVRDLFLADVQSHLSDIVKSKAYENACKEWYLPSTTARQYKKCLV